jgi:amino acid adenylation domain-containing protein
MYPERRTAWIIRGYHLDGAIDTIRLEDALSKLRERHWYLTCAIGPDGKVRPTDSSIPLIILSANGDPWEHARKYCRTRLEPFRLEHGELFRLYVFQGETHSAVVFAIHHVLADHHSVDVLTSELSALFEDDSEALAPPSDLMRAYEQQRLALEEGRPNLQHFWQSRIAQSPTARPLPVAKFQSDPVARNGALVRRKAVPGLADQCRTAAMNAGVSPYQWFLAAWIVLIGRYYIEDEVHVGTMFSTRNGIQQRDSIGCFQNVLIVGADLRTSKTFADVLADIRSEVGDAIAHGALPIDELARLSSVRRGSGQLFSTLFTLVATKTQTQLLGREVLHCEELDYGGTAFDLTFFVITANDDLSFAIEFDSALYDHTAVAAVFDHYQALLAHLAENEHCDWRRCSLAGAVELERLRAEWRQIVRKPLPSERLHDAFFRFAATNPGSAALQWGATGQPEELSYGELASRADAIARYINSVSDETESTVAVIGSWQPDTVAALIGILRSGRAYLPIDIDYPAARIEHILNDAGRPLVLLQNGSQPPEGFVDRCHRIADAISSKPTSHLPESANDVAYHIYTSGSSGAPKGVRVSHAAAVYSTNERNRVYADWPPERFLLLSSFAFDSAVAGLWWSLSTGAQIRLIDRQTARAADIVAELILREESTHTLCLPGQWSDICRISEHSLDSLKLVIVAGEACSANTVRHHFEKSSDAALFNEYGPTEMTVWSTFCQLENGAENPVPIGQPLALTQALVIDDYGNPVPVGLSGQLLLAGHGIAEGYTGGIDGGFTEHPIDADSRAYRTGDRVRIGTDGQLYYIGRIDEQVKYRGYRIGIESIEQTLSPNGQQVAIIPWNGISLEDMLARMPEDKAIALVDKYLATDR